MKKSKKLTNDIIWNILGTSINAFNSLLFLITVTRINGTTDAGIFTIAFSTACILYVIGIYSGRVFQVTELDNKINNKEFIINRIVSCILMMILAYFFVFTKGYDFNKSLVFILLSLYKCLEAFSDVFYGIMQKSCMLDKVGQSYFLKGILSIFIFIFIDIITHNMILSIFSIIIVWILFIVLFDIKYSKKLINKKETINLENVKNIFKSGFFIFGITFLGLYLINAPKYAIDNFLLENMQTIFGIIAMPATVMALISQFLLHPYLLQITKFCREKNIKSLKKLINKIIIVILLFGGMVSIAAYLFGITILNLIYGINLHSYKIQLTIIIVSATLYNIGIIYSSLLTTLRKTVVQFIFYIIISIMAAILSNILTMLKGINGAVFSYFIIMLIFFVGYILIQKIEISKIENNEGKYEK